MACEPESLIVGSRLQMGSVSSMTLSYRLSPDAVCPMLIRSPNPKHIPLPVKCLRHEDHEESTPRVQRKSMVGRALALQEGNLDLIFGTT